MRTKNKTICTLCKAEVDKTRNGFCEACDGASPVELNKRVARASVTEEQRAKKRAANEATFARLRQLHVYLPRGTKLEAAIDKRLESEKFSELAMNALAKFLKVENPHKSVGRPEAQEAPFD